MYSVFNNVHAWRIKTHNSRWMEAQNNMVGVKALESADIASQQTHCEPTDATNVDVVTNATPIGKGLDHINCYKMFCCNAYYTLSPL